MGDNLGKKIDVIIPAYNEENSVGKVIDDLPKGFVREIIVVDNNSSDSTFDVIQSHGATALKQPIQSCPRFKHPKQTLKPFNWLQS